jgi:hypothetical protein
MSLFLFLWNLFNVTLKTTKRPLLSGHWYITYKRMLKPGGDTLFTITYLIKHNFQLKHNQSLWEVIKYTANKYTITVWSLIYILQYNAIACGYTLCKLTDLFKMHKFIKMVENEIRYTLIWQVCVPYLTYNNMFYVCTLCFCIKIIM